MPEAHPARSRAHWCFFAYNLLMAVLLPVLLCLVAWKMLRTREDRVGFSERLGAVPPAAAALASHEDPVVWFHACSVGEVSAVDPIVRLLREVEPLAHIVLSTTTRTGREAARQRGLELDALLYFPFDLPFVVTHVLDAVKPDLLVMVETELWPNILAAAHDAGVRTAVVNGRISDRAFPRDRLIGPIFAWTLRTMSALLTQSEKDAERFRALGAPAERVQVLGNSKFDERTPAVSAAEADMLRLELGLAPGAPVLVAGSTREGEEQKILDAFDILRQERRDLQLIIAPRHPERGDAVARLLTEHGYAVHRRSRSLATEGGAPETPTDSQVRIVVLDTLGELTKVYALATVVFVGGSLVPWGGHNLLQPIAQGKPTLMGPYMHNQKGLAEIALAEGAAETVRNPQELAAAVGRLIASPAEQELFAARGRAMLERHRGASRRYAEALAELLPRHGAVPSSSVAA